MILSSIIVIRHSTREFMLAHRIQFGERHIRRIGEKRADLPPAVDANKITPGPSNEARYQLSQALKEMLEDIWREQIASRFGLENYEDLRQSLRELHKFNDERYGDKNARRTRRVISCLY